MYKVDNYFFSTNLNKYINGISCSHVLDISTVNFDIDILFKLVLFESIKWEISIE